MKFISTSTAMFFPAAVKSLRPLGISTERDFRISAMEKLSRVYARNLYPEDWNVLIDASSS
jgi:hypothetical protein